MTPLVKQPGFVIFDEEELRGQQPTFFFQNTIWRWCSEEELKSLGLARLNRAADICVARRKEYDVHTNTVGSGGSMPCGQMFDLNAICVRVSPNTAGGSEHKGPSLRVKLVFGASEDGPAFSRDMELGKVCELEKTIRFWPLENFRVEVTGECPYPVRVELHGDRYRYGRHSNVVSPEGEQLWQISEREMKLLAPLVEKAVADTKDKRERMTLIYMLSSIRENMLTLDGAFHAAQLLKDDISVMSFRTPDARDAYKKAFVAIGDKNTACWKMPEELESIEDDQLKGRVLEAWRAALARYQD
jgi:hypothetical protein